MTVYAGESVELTLVATNFNGSTIDNTSSVTVTISVFDVNAISIVDEQPMSFNAAENLWTYMWDTDQVLPGTYTSKTTTLGVGGTVSWEYKTVRLSKNKAGIVDVVTPPNGDGILDGGSA